MEQYNPVSRKEFTYSTQAIINFSCIYYLITTYKIFDCIIENAVIYEAQNLSCHNIIDFSIGVSNFKHMIDIKCNSQLAPNCHGSKVKFNKLKKIN